MSAKIDTRCPSCEATVGDPREDKIEECPHCGAILRSTKMESVEYFWIRARTKAPTFNDTGLGSDGEGQ